MRKLTTRKSDKNNKDKIGKDKQSAVYKLVCKECPKVYIGQTGILCQKRIKEYL